MSQNETSAALENLQQIKEGNDPRESEQDDVTIEEQSAIEAMEAEIHRLYDEYDFLAEHLPKSNLHWCVANWERKNGNCRYNRRTSKKVHGKRLSKLEDADGHHLISVNERIWEEGNHDAFINTVRHEVAHAVVYEKYDESQGHNENWERMAKRIGCSGDRCSNGTKSREYKYYFACLECGWKYGRHRKSKIIKQTHKRYCNNCKTKIVSWRAGKEKPTEPGTKNL